MSNLSLPTMTFKSLRKLTPDNGKNVTLANKTTASFFDNGTNSYILIQHHFHTIGKLYPDGTVFVHNAGYSSHTTATRIRAILTDNDVPFVYAIRDRSGVLFPKGLDKKDERTPLLWPGAIFTKDERYTAEVGNGETYLKF